MPDRALIRAEWHKLRSVPRWVIGLVGAVVITVGFSLLIAQSSGADFGGETVTTGPHGGPVMDDFHFVHQPMTGDGTMTVRVLSQTGVNESGEATDPQPWAKAGVMIKESTTAGSEYAAVLATPEHGVRLQSNFTTDIAGTDTDAAWLRLVRDGSTITGFESADGLSWDEIGSVALDNLSGTVEAGFFVASPPEVRVERRAGSTGVGHLTTLGIATFDNVALDAGQLRDWMSDEIGHGFSRGPAEETDGVFTVSGSGDIADNPPDDDVVQLSLTGALFGSLAVIAVCVLFVTAEYRRGMIRTTLAATPRRGRVLAAKALVAGGVTFAVGLVGCFGAFFLAYPLLRENGFAPPYMPEPSLSDPNVLRAIIGSAALLAVVAVLSVAVGAIVRRSAAAIALVTALFFLPALLGLSLPPEPAEWLVRLTPASGLAIQRSLAPTEALIEPWSMIQPWFGFAVLCAYAAAALLAARWVLQRRDA